MTDFELRSKLTTPIRYEYKGLGILFLDSEGISKTIIFELIKLVNPYLFTRGLIYLGLGVWLGCWKVIVFSLASGIWRLGYGQFSLIQN